MDLLSLTAARPLARLAARHGEWGALLLALSSQLYGEALLRYPRRWPLVLACALAAGLAYALLAPCARDLATLRGRPRARPRRPWLAALLSLAVALRLVQQLVLPFAELEREQRVNKQPFLILETRRGREGAGPLHIVARALGGLEGGAVELVLDDGGLLEAGDVVVLSGTLRRPRPASNPGGFDRRRQLHLRGIAWQLRARRLQREAGLRCPLWLWPRRLLGRLRLALAAGLEAQLGPAHAGLAGTILLGLRDALDPETRDAFRRAGLSHILVVSGTHLSFLLVAAQRLFVRLPVLARLRRGASAALLLLLAALTGWGAAVLRAALFALCGLIARRARRPSQPLQRLAVIWVLTAIAAPRLTLTLGYRMSLAASVGILSLAPALQRALAVLARALRTRYELRRLRRRPGALLRPPSQLWRLPFEALTMTLAAQLAMLPFLVAFAQPLSPLVLLANLVALPLLQLLMCALPLLALPANALSRLLLGPLATLCRACLGALEWLADALTAPGMPRLRLLWRDLGLIALVLLVAYALIGRSCGRARLAVAMALLIAVAGAVHAGCQPALSLIQLDVGQGDARLLCLRGGPTILIDCGTAYGGGPVIAPALTALGRRRIDLLILTHWDLDHCGATQRLIDDGLVAAICWPPEDGESEAGQRLQLKQAAEAAGIYSYDWPRGPLDIAALQLRSLVPEYVAARRGSNENSRVLRIDYGGWRGLLLADVDDRRERELLQRGVIAPVDLVGVAHHGSRYSSDPRLVRATRPAVALISVGPNLYGHPHPAVLESWRGAGSLVLRSDHDGAIRMDFADDYVRISTILGERDGLPTPTGE